MSATSQKNHDPVVPKSVGCFTFVKKIGSSLR